MHVAPVEDVEALPVDMEGARETTVRWLIDKKVGARSFAMRLFTMRRGGCSPYHQHDWEHEVFVLKGRGVLRTEGGETPLSARTAVFVPPMEWHQFSNAGRGTLEFLCLIPIKD